MLVQAIIAKHREDLSAMPRAVLNVLALYDVLQESFVHRKSAIENTLKARRMEYFLEYLNDRHLGQYPNVGRAFAGFSLSYRGWNQLPSIEHDMKACLQPLTQNMNTRYLVHHFEKINKSIVALLHNAIKMNELRRADDGAGFYSRMKELVRQEIELGTLLKIESVNMSEYHRILKQFDQIGVESAMDKGLYRELSACTAMVDDRHRKQVMRLFAEYANSHARELPDRDLLGLCFESIKDQGDVGLFMRIQARLTHLTGGNDQYQLRKSLREAQRNKYGSRHDVPLHLLAFAISGQALGLLGRNLVPRGPYYQYLAHGPFEAIKAIWEKTQNAHKAEWAYHQYYSLCTGQMLRKAIQEDPELEIKLFGRAAPAARAYNYDFRLLSISGSGHDPWMFQGIFKKLATVFLEDELSPAAIRKHLRLNQGLRINDIDHDPGLLVAVHVDRKQYTRYSLAGNRLYGSLMRPTIHFTMNCMTPAFNADRSDSDIAVIAPFDQLYRANAARFYGGCDIDFYFVGFLDLPDSAVVLKRGFGGDHSWEKHLLEKIHDMGFPVIQGSEARFSAEFLHRYPCRPVGKHHGTDVFEADAHKKGTSSSIWRETVLGNYSADSGLHRFVPFVQAWKEHWDSITRDKPARFLDKLENQFRHSFS